MRVLWFLGFGVWVLGFVVEFCLLSVLGLVGFEWVVLGDYLGLGGLDGVGVI